LPSVVDVGGRDVPLLVRRSARARRLTLSVDGAGGRVTLTLPARATLAQAAAFLDSRAAWLGGLEPLPVPAPLEPGARIPFAGGTLTLATGAGRTRRDGDVLLVAGRDFGRAAEAWLRREALARLDVAARRYAAAAGRPVASVGVGDPVRRWGSCAADGAIRFSWRLVLAPPWVLEAVAAHEATHLVEANHGPAFHALADRLSNGDERRARAWLRANGAALHAIGRRGGG
jgi:hypothetical protein